MLPTGVKVLRAVSEATSNAYLAVIHSCRAVFPGCPSTPRPEILTALVLGKSQSSGKVLPRSDDNIDFVRGLLQEETAVVNKAMLQMLHCQTPKATTALKEPSLARKSDARRPWR